MVFNKLKIQSKLLLVTFISGLAMIVMSAFILNELNNVQSLDVKHEKQRELFHLSSSAEKTLIQLSEVNNLFIETGSTIYADKFSKLYNKLKDQIEVISLKDQKIDYKKIKKHLNFLNGNYNTVFDARQKHGLSGNQISLDKLKGDAGLFEVKIRNLVSSNANIPVNILKDLQNHVLLIRLDESKIIHENYSEWLIYKVEASFFDVRAYLDTIEISDLRRNQIEEALSTYEASLYGYLSTKFELEQKQIVFVKTKNQLQRLLNAKTVYYEKAIYPLLNQAKTARADMQYNLIIMLAASLLVVVMVGVVITNDVSNSYQFMRLYMKKMAKGEYDFKVFNDDLSAEMEEISKNLKRVQGRLHKLEEPIPPYGPQREKAITGPNVIDFRQKMFEMNRIETSPYDTRPKKKT